MNKMLKDWNHLFREIIVARGIDYHTDEKVLSLEKDRNVYKATVAGEKNYTVQVILLKDKVLGAYCDCPYYARGHRCKHIVATLLEIENKNTEKAE